MHPSGRKTGHKIQLMSCQPQENPKFEKSSHRDTFKDAVDAWRRLTAEQKAREVELAKVTVPPFLHYAVSVSCCIVFFAGMNLGDHTTATATVI